MNATETKLAERALLFGAVLFALVVPVVACLFISK